MRSRLLDAALVVGLVVVAGGIMWTLFNLGSGPRADAPTTTTVSPPATPNTGSRTTPVDPAGSRVTPVAPNATGDPDAAATTSDPDAVVVPPTVDAPDAEANDPVATPAPEPRVVPEGSIALERIGFSYVTGGPGACGVVLEAWVHVAVSRDLLATYGCGAEVLVTLDDPAGGRSEVAGVIGDTMNPSFERTVNVYVAEDEDAFAYGLTTGVFAPR